MMRKGTFLLMCLFLLMCKTCVISAAEIRVDFGTTGPLQGWTEWPATSGSNTIDGVDFTLSNSGCEDGPKLRSGVGDELIRDLLSEEDRGTGGWSYTLEITNLPAGLYEITTYFNNANDYDNWGGGTTTMEIQGGSTTSGEVPDRVSDYTQALALTLSFTSFGPGDTTTVNYTGTEQPCICGFKLYPAGPTIEFAASTSENLEQVTPAGIELSLSNAQEGQTYSADYAVTGGTAIGAGIDFFLPGFCGCDLDTDGQVDFIDLALLTEKWLLEISDDAVELTADGKINADDFAVCARQWLYSCGDNTIQFEPGVTSKILTIDITQDGRDEEDETIELTLSNPAGAQLGRINHTYTILDPWPRVSFASANSSGAESITDVNIPVNLTLDTRTVTVDYTVSAGTASGGGTDYTLADGTLTFSQGVTTQNISINVVNDSNSEPEETIVLTLSNPYNAKLGDVIQHTYTINDDDGVIWDGKRWYYSTIPNTRLFINDQNQLEWTPEVGGQFIAKIPNRSFSETGDIVQFQYLLMTDGEHDCPPDSCLICEGRCSDDITCLSGTSDFRIGLFESDGQYINANGFEIRNDLFVGYKGYEFRFGPNLDTDTPYRWIECPGEDNEEVHKTGNFAKKPENSDNLLTINEGLMADDYIGGFGLTPGDFSLLTLRLERPSYDTVELSITLNGTTYTATDNSFEDQPEKIDVIAVHMRNPRPFTRFVLDTVE